MASNTNPGNFANRGHDEVENLARKGGQSSHNSGFASMAESKQVIQTSLFRPLPNGKQLSAILTKCYRRILHPEAATIPVETLSLVTQELERHGRVV